MSVFWIAWKSIKHRGFASFLTIISMMLGVMLVVCVLTIHGVVKRSFSNNGEVGYDLIIGAKGGNLQLALNSVYYLSQPVETIPYEYLMECEDQAFREKEVKRSIHYRAHRGRSSVLEAIQENLQLVGFGGPVALANELSLDAFDDAGLVGTGMFEPGIFQDLGYVDWVIPILLGDYFDEFRVVATTSRFFDDRLLEFPEEDFFDLLQAEDDPQPSDVVERDPPKPYEDLEKVTFSFAKGRAFVEYNEENAYFECVLGSRVARETGLTVGESIQITHGVPASKGGDAALHNQKFHVVGVLEATGRPEDRAVYVNMEGFFLMNDHATSLLTDEEYEQIIEEKGEAFIDQEFDQRRVPLPLEQRRISAILVASATLGGVNPYAGSIQKEVNKGRLEKSTQWTDYSPPRLQKAASAIFPIAEINKLFVYIVTPIQTVLLILTFMICLVSGISILVSIYNSMSDRRHEIAVMRALGANRRNILMIILTESSMLGMLGLGMGWVFGHGIIGISAPYVDSYAGVTVSFFDIAPPISEYLPWVNSKLSAEFFLLPFILVLTILVGVIPAISAYRTDVSQNLGK
jgi:putative ABC transport system permease protein